MTNNTPTNNDTNNNMTNTNTNSPEIAPNDQFIEIMVLPKTIPLGWALGTIKDVTKATGPDSTLKLHIQLDETDDAGNPFTADRTYRLQGRGAKEFLKDVTTLTGQEVTTKDLAHFKKAIVVNKRASFDIKTKKEKGQVTAYFTELKTTAVNATSEQ